MRSLDDARVGWNALRQYESLRELRQGVRLDGDVSVATAGSRSACWKVFLLFESLDAAEWIRTLSSTRSAYNSLRTHFLRHIENPDELTAGFDPLNAETDSSPWAQLRKDEELRGEILQDVVRCMPENLYFRQPDTQRTLTDILFIFCKLNPDVGYRQGMHELLAPILWVVERDAIDLGQSSKALGEDAVVKAIFDAEHIEHDTFALFGQVMQSAKGFYEQTTSNGTENPMVARSRRIFKDLLPLVDERLASHLEQIDIIPQVFLIRWVRLLFGREFSFDGMLTLWDVIFAEDPALEIVDYICLAMILRIRWDLIDADYNIALTLLLRYPEPDSQLPAQTFALDGLYLREHMDRHSGSYLVSKYTGKPVEQAGRPVTPPALQRNITTFSGQNAIRAATGTQSPRPGRNFEAVLQSTARNIYARGEKLGINKAVRSAVDEVHKKAQEIRDSQAPVTPPSWRQRGGSRTSLGSAPLLNRVQALEDRSKQLAKLLDGAVTELWEFQKQASETVPNDEKAVGVADVEQLSLAIAKVQFIQVYLDDPGLPLPQQSEDVPQDYGNSTAPSLENTDEGREQANPLDDKTPDTDRGPTSLQSEALTPQPSRVGDEHDEAKVVGLADPASFDDFDTQPEPTTEVSRASNPEVIVSNPTETEEGPAMLDTIHSPPTSRPRLEQSSFSWMLGKQDGSEKPFHIASAFPPEHSRPKGALFGGQAVDSKAASKDKRRGSSGSKQRRKQSGDSGVAEQHEEEVFDLGSLRHSKGKKV